MKRSALGRWIPSWQSQTLIEHEVLKWFADGKGNTYPAFQIAQVLAPSSQKGNKITSPEDRYLYEAATDALHRDGLLSLTTEGLYRISGHGVRFVQNKPPQRCPYCNADECNCDREAKHEEYQAASKELAETVLRGVQDVLRGEEGPSAEKTPEPNPMPKATAALAQQVAGGQAFQIPRCPHVTTHKGAVVRCQGWTGHDYATGPEQHWGVEPSGGDSLQWRTNHKGDQVVFGETREK